MRIIVIFMSFILMSLSFSTNALAEIYFDSNGKWHTTFDCSEWDQGSGEPLYCDGLIKGGDWYADDKGSQITSVANNPAGAGGKGARFWKGSGYDNNTSTSFTVIFPSRVKEIWVRWYERYEEGFEWAGGRIDVKSLYFRTAEHRDRGAGSPYMGFYGTSGYRIYNNGSTGSFPVTYSGGWGDLYPTGVADGSWHCFEIYMKMDTDGTDGIGRIWINGELVAEDNSVNWSDNDADARKGFAWFDFLSNQKDPELDRPYYVDVDDMVIYNKTPPNTDNDGNPFVGPINWDSSSSSSLPPPTGLTTAQNP